jgi:hypothetical protein
MTKVLKQMYQLLLTEPHAPTVCNQLELMLREAIAELESQEPVAWQWLSSAHFRKKLPKDADITAWNPLYTAPPQRTWVGLTKEDKDLIEDLCEMMIGDAAFSTIDAILKGKNT